MGLSRARPLSHTKTCTHTHVTHTHSRTHWCLSQAGFLTGQSGWTTYVTPPMAAALLVRNLAVTYTHNAHACFCSGLADTYTHCAHACTRSCMGVAAGSAPQSSRVRGKVYIPHTHTHRTHTVHKKHARMCRQTRTHMQHTHTHCHTC